MPILRGCQFPKIIPQGCPRCGGSLFEDIAMKEWKCMLCARPFQIESSQVIPAKYENLTFTFKEVGVRN